MIFFAEKVVKEEAGNNVGGGDILNEVLVLCAVRTRGGLPR